MSESRTRWRGPIAWMAQNSVAANFAMLVIIVGGVLGVLRAKQEIFPEFSLDIVSVQVPYPGASPEEVEQGIILAVEEAVRGIDGVKHVRSVAAEGVGTVTVELQRGADPSAVLADVKTAVDRITSFPEEAEEPVVQLLAPRARVVSLILAGDRPLKELHFLAERARSQLLASGEVTQVAIEGVPPLEVSISVPQKQLDALGLTLEQVAAAVRASSIELPAGSVKTEGGEILVRVSDRKRSGYQFEDILIRSDKRGSKVRLGDIAVIEDGFEESDVASYLDGHRAVRVTAYRVGDETPAGVAAAVRRLAQKMDAELPDDIQVRIWQDDSTILQDRIDLLNKNAAYGMVLVVLLLAAVLRLRLALWVALGIPISFLGTLFLMPALGATINMVTLFALIIVLGMVVDDAIVVGENIYHKIQEGRDKLEAVVEGAREMAVPVTFSILTSVAAFAPMLFVPGIMGKIFVFIPMVVILVLLFSLFESFFILPAHILHHTGRTDAPRGPLGRLQRRVDTGLEWFIERIYRPLLVWTLRHKGVTAATAVAVLLTAVGVVRGGLVPFKFFPNLEGDLVQVSAELPYGTPISETIKVKDALEKAAHQAIAQSGGQRILVGMFTNLGAGPSVQRGPHAGTGGAQGSHLVTIELNLVPSEQREVSAEQVRAAWERATPPLPGLRSLTFNSNVGPSAGEAVKVQLAHEDLGVLEKAAADLEQAYRGFSDLTDIKNGFSEGKRQIDLHLLPKARALGLTSFEIARQIRGAFYGVEALREQRGRNEIKVMVRYPRWERQSEFNVDTLLIRTPEGGSVPLSYVAQRSANTAPTSINREDGRRIVSVSAELKPGVPSPDTVIAALKQSVLPKLTRTYRDLDWSMGGEQREMQESMGALGMNFVVALLVMFGMMAIPFRSYIQPFIIMTSIPFGMIGAVLGHLIMGYNLSFVSMMGIVALAGVVVNDAIVLVDAANQRRRAGHGLFESVVWAGTRRFRPVLLTSLTTFLGLLPMIFETSLQARFLIPMAVSLGFGILVATGITLVLIPTLYLVFESVRGAVGDSPTR